jgi:hypothetical protein
MNKRTPAIAYIIIVLSTALAISQSIPPMDHQQFIQELKKEADPDREQQVFPMKRLNAVARPAADDIGEAPDLNWSGQFGGSANDFAADILSDDEGNVYVSGSFSGEIEVGSQMLTSAGIRDAIVAKLDGSGNPIWVTQLSPAVGEITTAGGLCMDNEGNIYLTGSFTGDVQFGSVNLSGQGQSSLYFAKLSSSGDVLMASKHETATDPEQGMMIENDQENNIYILGVVQDEYGSRILSSVLKFDPSGTLLWEQEHDEVFLGMKVGGNGIFFTGIFFRYNDGFFNNDVVLPQSDIDDAFVAMANLNGAFQWATRPGHTDDPNSWPRSRGQCIGMDENGEIYISGTFSQNIIFGSDTLLASGWNDEVFLAKCNSSGAFLWGSHLINRSVMDSYTAGSGHSYLALQGEITKLDSEGSILWTEEVIPSQSALAENTSGKLLTAGTDMGLICVSQLDQMADPEWLVRFVGNTGTAQILGMVSDHLGNLYTYGSVTNTMEFFGETVQQGEFLAKQHGLGEVIWINHFPGVTMVHGTIGDQLHIDTLNQALFFGGILKDTLDMSPHAVHVPKGESSMVVVKLDLNGNYMFSVQENFESRVYFDGIVTDHTGNLIITGKFGDTIILGEQELVSEGLDDLMILKYNPSGKFMWVKRAGGESMEWESLASADAQNNIYFIGEYTSVDVMVDQTAVTLENGSGNILLSKLNPAGEVQWIKILASTGHDWHDDLCWPTGIRTANDGSVYIKGSMYDTAYFDQIMIASPFEGYNKFIVKTDANGNVAWANCLSLNGARYRYWFDYNQFDIDPEGSVYFGGQVKDTLYFGDDFQYIPSSPNDLYVAKYTSGGMLDWVKGIRGNESTTASNLRSVGVYGTENVFVGATFSGSLSVDDETATSPTYHGFIAMLGPDIAVTTNLYKKQEYLFDIYPNPSDGMVMLTSSEMQGRFVDVINEMGQIVHSEEIRSDSQILDVSRLSKGLYLVTIRDTDDATAKKLIIGP